METEDGLRFRGPPPESHWLMTTTEDGLSFRVPAPDVTYTYTGASFFPSLLDVPEEEEESQPEESEVIETEDGLRFRGPPPTSHWLTATTEDGLSFRVPAGSRDPE